MNVRWRVEGGGEAVVGVSAANLGLPRFAGYVGSTDRVVKGNTSMERIQDAGIVNDMTKVDVQRERERYSSRLRGIGTNGTAPMTKPD